MHGACLDFIRRIRAASPAFFTGRDVLDVGSRDVNGSARMFFADGRYTGTDVVAGKGVDVVADAAKLPFEDESFDVVLCLETFEHAKEWRQILAELKRCARPGGLIVATMATTGRPVHGLDEWGFGHYGNVAADELRPLIGDVLFWEEDYVNCDLRAAWVR
jgi:SAM-dependent methyltransferase